MPPRTMTPAVVVLVLTLLLGIQPITTDLYLPALPGIARELGAPMAGAQLTLSALILAFGFGQLACGPLADRYGRRPVLLWGLGLYTVASLGSAFSPSIEWLIALRALQGVAMAAAVTCGRSIIRDLYQPTEGAAVMSRAMTGLGVIAFASPTLGGFIAAAFGWQHALAVLAVFGVIALAVIAWRFEESLPAKDPRATRLGPWLANLRAVVGHPTFRAFTLLASATYGGLFTMLAASSFVFIDLLGTSRQAYGLTISSFSLAYICGTLLCRRLLARHGLRGAVSIGAWFSLAGGLSMALLSLAGVASPWAIIVPQWVYMIGHGINQPCAQAGAVGPFPDKAGVAAALSGFAMMVVAFAVGVVLGETLGRSALPLTLGVGLGGVVVALTAWTLVRRHGEGAPVHRPQAAT